MACCNTCGCSPCSCNGSSAATCDPANEAVSSQIANFVSAFFGSVTKTCVNGVVVWTLPSDISAGFPGIPRLANEGLAAYIFRLMGMLGVFPQGEWSGATTYPDNAFVSRCGSGYISLRETNNEPPETSPTAWQLAISGAYTCGI